MGVPEEGGRALISTDPLAPGSVFIAAMSVDRVALHRIEISCMSGSGKLRITGNPDRSMMQSIDTTLDYIRAHKSQLGIEKNLESHDFHANHRSMSPKEGSQAGVVFLIALYSLLWEIPVHAGLVVLDEMTIRRKILPVLALIEPLRFIMDNGAKKVLIPLANNRNFLRYLEIVEKGDPIFYSEPLQAALKAVVVA